VTTFTVPGEVKMRNYNPTYKPNARQLQKIIDLIAKAKKPVLFSGGGVSLSKAHKN
jgi:acetolactate synthase I/II/III large subunit